MLSLQALTGLLNATDNAFVNGIIAFALLVIIVLATTRAVTSFQYFIGSLDSGKKRKPLTVPYSIPYIGSALSMIDQHGLHSALARNAQANRPLRLKIGPKGIYLIFGPDNVRQVFANSKQLSMRARVLDVMHANRVPPDDFHLLKSDESGEMARPLYDIAPEKRIWYNASAAFTAHLAHGHAVQLLADKFQEQFTKELAVQSDKTFVSVPLYKFLQKHMLVASGIAFTGEELFVQNPTWHKTLWDYDAIFLPLNLGLPDWMVPSVRDARDRMKESIVKWYKAAYAKDDLKASGDPDWEPLWGSRFWREVVRNFLSAGMTVEGAAASSMSTIWATHSNAIPATSWVVFEIVTRPSLYTDIMAELSTAMTSSNPPTFNKDKLLALPLLNSVYKEVLRIRTSVIVYREASSEISISNTIIPKGAVLMASSWPAHTHPQNWASFDSSVITPGSTKSHVGATAAPMEFDPYRFLAMENIKADPAATKVDRDRAAAALSPNNLFPWGGGTHMCAGRFFAKQEIFIGAAIVLAGFDIEFEGWEKHAKGWDEPKGKSKAPPKGMRAAQPDSSYAGGGVLPPDRDLRVKMKRKAW